MPTSIKLCPVSDLEAGFPVRVEHDGLPPLAIYWFEGKFYVSDDTCTHGQASLCDGYQNEDTIECPYHGGVFSIITGEPLALPCSEALAVYPAREEAGFIWIDRD
ncbi:MAG: non-heme iron oxygenase ferredoxin subunit [Gammaproteobacteria bacterium]